MVIIFTPKLAMLTVIDNVLIIMAKKNVMSVSTLKECRSGKFQNMCMLFHTPEPNLGNRTEDMHLALC